MTYPTIAIVGATGKTGARVINRLTALGYAPRALSRCSDYAFDWANKKSWKKALAGAQVAYVTYYPDLAVPQAEADIVDFVDIAKDAGIQHLVLLSGRGEEGAKRAEAIVKNSGLTWNIVRASWFMQNFSESFMLDEIAAGKLVLPEPNALEPFIDANDIADVAVEVLTRADLNNQAFEITGPELLSFEQCIQTIAKASHRSLEFQSAPIDAYLAGAKAQGLPDEIAWLINELFINVLDGRNESTTNTVEAVLGRPARSFQQYVDSTVKTGVWENSQISTQSEVA